MPTPPGSTTRPVRACSAARRTSSWVVCPSVSSIPWWRLVEKPAAHEAFSDLGNAGVYVCEPSVYDALPDPVPVPYDFAGELFPAMIARGHVLRAWRTDATVIDIGSFAGLRAAEDAVAAGIVAGEPLC